METFRKFIDEKERIMITLPEEIVTEFSNEIKNNFATYSAIYISFVEYIKEQYIDYEYFMIYISDSLINLKSIKKRYQRFTFPLIPLFLLNFQTIRFLKKSYLL